MKNTWATFSFHTSCSEQNSAAWKNNFSTWNNHTNNDRQGEGARDINQGWKRAKQISFQTKVNNRQNKGDKMVYVRRKVIRDCEEEEDYEGGGWELLVYASHRISHTYHGIIFTIPVNARLSHQDGDVFIQFLVVQFQIRFDLFTITCQSCVLDLLSWR